MGGKIYIPINKTKQHVDEIYTYNSLVFETVPEYQLCGHVTI